MVIPGVLYDGTENTFQYFRTEASEFSELVLHMQSLFLFPEFENHDNE